MYSESMEFLPLLESKLDEWRSKNLYRKLPNVGDRARDFSTNDYLGLAHSQTLATGSKEAVEALGTGSTGSRLLGGNLKIHENLELAITAFKKFSSSTHQALIFNSGFVANLGVLSTLPSKGDWIISDKLNHASLIDGARMAAEISGAVSRFFNHLDYERAEELLALAPPDALKFLVSDSVFSMDGDVADLPRLLALAKKYGAVLILDEAHATGVLGASGRGIFEHFGINPASHDLPEIIEIGTFSKALGSFGAYVIARKLIREYLIQASRPFIYTTALPPSVIGANLASIEFLENQSTASELLNQLHLRIARFSGALGIKQSIATPIIPIFALGGRDLTQLQTKLSELGFRVPYIRPPTVAKGSERLRVSLSLNHSLEMIDELAAVLKKERQS